MVATNTPKKSKWILVGIPVISAVMIAVALIIVFLQNSTEPGQQKVERGPVEQLTIESADPYASGETIVISEDSWKVNDEGKIEWRSAGSSSCPPIIIKAEYEETAGMVTMTEKQYSTNCTNDLVPVHQVISRTEGKFPSDTTIAVTY